MDILDQHDRGPLRDDLFEELDPRVLEAIARGKRVESVDDVESKRETQDLARPESVEHDRRRIALEDAEMLLQDLAEGPVGNALAVRKTSSGSPQRLPRAISEPFPELAQ